MSDFIFPLHLLLLCAQEKREGERMKRYAIVLVILFSACTMTPAVKELGNNRYATDADAPSVDSARTAAMKQAAAFCSGSGKTLNAESASDQSMVSVYRSNVVFSCN
jgi:hypothetical protein